MRRAIDSTKPDDFPPNIKAIFKRQAPCSGDLEETTTELLYREALVAALFAGEVIAGSHIAAMAFILLR